MARSGRCRCGTLLRFKRGTEGYKTRCPNCRAVVRLRVASWPERKGSREVGRCRCGARLAALPPGQIGVCEKCAKTDLVVAPASRPAVVTPGPSELPALPKKEHFALPGPIGPAQGEFTETEVDVAALAELDRKSPAADSEHSGVLSIACPRCLAVLPPGTAACPDCLIAVDGSSGKPASGLRPLSPGSEVIELEPLESGGWWREFFRWPWIIITLAGLAVLLAAVVLFVLAGR